MNTLITERLDREFDTTKKALDNVKVILEKGNKFYEIALEFRDTAQRYYKDALYFKGKGDNASAFGALNYAHGWLDAGKLAGFLGK